MADIKIEKKGGGIPWWVWLLLALLIVGVLFWVFGNRDNDRVATAPVAATAPMDTTAEPNMVAASGPAITDLSTMTAANGTSLVGREVKLTSARVAEMAGDATFWLEGADGKRAFVVLNEKPQPGNGVEGRVNVNKGDTVALNGTVRSAADGAPDKAALGDGVGSNKVSIPNGVTEYIYADSVVKSG